MSRVVTAFRVVPGVVLGVVLTAVCGSGAEDVGVRQSILAIQDAIQAGDLAAASTLLDASLVRNPGDGGLLNLRGVVHAQRNELPQARADFSEAVRGAPGLTAAWQNLGRACQMEAEQAREPAEQAIECAANAWRHVLRLNSSSGRQGEAEARESLALLDAWSGKFAESLREMETLPAAQASTARNGALRCFDLAGLDRVAAAKALALRLAGRTDFSEADLAGMQRLMTAPRSAAVVVTMVEALDARHAASAESLRNLAIAYEQLNRAADARTTLERVALLDPKNTAHLLELARLADAGKDYEAAVGYLGHARDLEPDNAQIHFLFAMTAVAMKLPVEARRSLDRALELDPDNANYNYAMGTVILTTRDAATASTYFEKYVKAKPVDPQGHFALGVAYFSSGDYEKAKDQMRSVEAQPKTAAGAEYFLGRMARIEDQPEEARRHLQKSLTLMPSFAEAHVEMARVCLREGHLEEAHAELTRALQLDPDSFQGNAQLLALYQRTHDPGAAKQAELVKKLDENRSKRAELMLRTIEVRPE